MRVISCRNCKGDRGDDRVMRCFLAIPLEPEISWHIWNTLQPLRESLDWKWVKPSHYHLTVRFLGEIDSSSIPDLCGHWRTLLTRTEPFAIRLRGLGTFPDRPPAKVFWCGMDKGIQSWRELCSVAGHQAPPSRLVPHVTLARIRRESRPTLLNQWIQRHGQTIWGEQTVRSVTLFESILHPWGPVYKPVEIVPLAGTKS